MALSARFSLLHSDLNNFLFASVGDEQNGMSLSVVSAFTRLGLDPWEEGARLAVLPKPRAVEVLAPMIARLSIDRSQPSDNLTISQRLVELLPAPGQAAAWDREQAGAKDKTHSYAMILLASLLAAAVLFSMWRF
jgi:hypothetical protein